MTTFLALTVVGIVVGCIYALTATGLVVTYITSGIFNFAHGAVGMIAAFTYWQLTVKHGWPVLPSLVLVILVLVKIGVLNYRILSKARRYMIVINLILGALLTTPEVVTQVIMFIPLQLLYEISIWIAWYWERQEKKKQQAQGAN